jgi:hypothetical protein
MMPIGSVATRASWSVIEVGQGASAVLSLFVSKAARSAVAHALLHNVQPMSWCAAPRGSQSPQEGWQQPENLFKDGTATRAREAVAACA